MPSALRGDRSVWLSRVLFNFEHVEALLDKLSVLPSAKLSQICHLRTRAQPLILYFEEHGHDACYRLAWSLKLLPGLRLDTLTVLGSSRSTNAHGTLTGMIKHGNGWKELCYVTMDSTMLGFQKETWFGADPDHDRRRPQPSTCKSHGFRVIPFAPTSQTSMSQHS